MWYLQGHSLAKTPNRRHGCRAAGAGISLKNTNACPTHSRVSPQLISIAPTLKDTFCCVILLQTGIAFTMSHIEAAGVEEDRLAIDDVRYRYCADRRRLLTM